MDNEILFFSSSMWDCLDVILKQQQDRKKIYDESYKLLDEKIQIDENYCKNLEKLISKSQFENPLDINLINLHQQIKQMFMHQVQQIKHFSKQFKEEILVNLKMVGLRHVEFMKKAYEDERKMEKELRSLAQNVERQEQEYISRESESEQYVLMDYLNEINSNVGQEREMMKNRAVFGLKASKSSEGTYRDSLTQYNSYLMNYNQRHGQILLELQEMDDQRNKLLHDSILKTLIYQISLYKAMQYDLDKTHQNIQTIDPTQDTQAFIKASASPRTPLTARLFYTYITFLNQSLSNSNRPQMEKILNIPQIKQILNDVSSKNVGDEEQYKLTFVEPYQKEKLATYEIGNIIRAQFEGEVNEMLPTLSNYLQDALERRLVIMAIQMYRIIGKFELTPEGFQNMTNVCNLILTDCMKYKDTECIRKLMIMTLTYYKQGEQGKKIFLNQEVRSHAVWQSKDFWESALFEMLADEHKNQEQFINYKETLMQKIQREQNLFYAQILSLCHNMCIFNCKKTNIKELANKFTRRLQLTEDQIKDINSIIDQQQFEEQQQDQSVKELLKSLFK